jgi:hypothetical protein
MLGKRELLRIDRLEQLHRSGWLRDQERLLGIADPVHEPFVELGVRSTDRLLLAVKRCHHLEGRRRPVYLAILPLFGYRRHAMEVDARKAE